MSATDRTHCGVYTILVESQVSNSNATVDTYELNVLPVVDTTTPLVIGQTTSGAITSFGQTESFTFDVPEFGSYYFDNFSLTSSVRWTLSGPAGNVVSNRVVSATDSLNGNGVLNLAAGSYTLTFDGTGEDLGEYEFRIIDLATATSIELDTPTTGEFTNPTETDAYQFEATGGDEIILEFTEVSDFRSSAYRLIDQNGLLVVSGRSLVSSIPVTLGLTGTYTLVVESSVRNEDVDTYTVNVALQGNTPIVPFAGEALVLGTPVSGEIGGPDAIDPYQFTLTERTTVHFDSRTNSALTWSLVGPEGTLINNRRFDQSDSFNGNTILDLPAGDYQLQVTGSTSGEYSFNLLALSDAAVITPGTPFSGTLTTPTQTDAYQFDANEGELFYFDVVSASDDRNSLFRLIDPAGETAFTSTRLNDRAVFEIELAGTPMSTLTPTRSMSCQRSLEHRL